MEREYLEYIKIITDASEMLESRVGISFVIPDQNIVENKGITDNLAVYTGELMLILMALDLVEEARVRKVLVCSDSSSALTRIHICSQSQDQTLH